MRQLVLRCLGPALERALGAKVSGEAWHTVQHAQGRDIDDVAVALFDHARDQVHGDTDGAEIIQLHGALVIMEAISCQQDGATDRASGVVDQDINATELDRKSTRLNSSHVKIS